MVFRLFDTLGYNEKKKVDKYPLVPALRDLYLRYENMEFEENSKDEKIKNLDKLLKKLDKDEDFKRLAKLSGRVCILEISEGFHLNINSDGEIYLYDFVTSGGGLLSESTEYEKEIKNISGDSLKMLKSSNKLKEGILDYIKKSLYTHYD